MKVKNAINLKFRIKARFGELIDDELSFVFTISIENTTWEEIVAFYPFLDELSQILEENPLLSLLHIAPFPTELLDNYTTFVEIFKKKKEQTAEKKSMLDTIAERLEKFMACLLSNINLIPKEIKGIVKQLFFKSVHKVKVLECIVGHNWGGRGAGAGAGAGGEMKAEEQSPAEAKDSSVEFLKRLLSTQTEGKVLLDALEGVRAENAMKNVFSEEKAVYQGEERESVVRGSNPLPGPPSRFSTVLSPIDTDLALSPLSPLSPLPSEPTLPIAPEEPPSLLAELGLTDLDLAICLQNLKEEGARLSFLLPDKLFRGRECEATLSLPAPGGILEVAVKIGGGKKGAGGEGKLTKLVYDIRGDVGQAHPGQGPTLSSLPADLPTGGVFHICLHNRPELNFSCENEKMRNIFYCALNRYTGGMRLPPGKEVRSGVAVSNHMLRLSLSQSPSQGSVSLVPTPTQRGSLPPTPLGGMGRIGEEEEWGREREDFSLSSDVLFSLPLKMQFFSFASYLSRPRLGGARKVGKISLSYHAPREEVLARAPRFLVLSSMQEIVLFSLPEALGAGGEKEKERKELVGVSEKLLHLPFPVNYLQRRDIFCEKVVYLPGIITVEKRDDEMLLLQTEEEVLNLSLPSPEEREKLVNLIITMRRSNVKALPSPSVSSTSRSSLSTFR